MAIALERSAVGAKRAQRHRLWQRVGHARPHQGLRDAPPETRTSQARGGDARPLEGDGHQAALASRARWIHMNSSVSTSTPPTIT